MTQLHIIDSGCLSAEENMEIDRELLASLEDRPLLRFYGWSSPSITYGYFMKVEQFLHLDRIREAGWDLAKRPTGGGIIFHQWDFTFSFLLPASHPLFSHHTLNNYAFVHSIVADTLSELAGFNKVSLLQKAESLEGSSSENFCMACPTIYDLVLEEKKIAGAAQRKTKKGYLHQGSLSLQVPDFDILEKFLIDDGTLASKIIETSFPLSSLIKEENVSQALKKGLMESFSATLDTPYEAPPTQKVHISAADKLVRSKKF